MSIPGYQILEQIYSGSRTLVYRAVRQADDKPVVMKCLRNPHPKFVELAQFKNQYAIASSFNLPGVVQVYSLEPCQNSDALIMEDFGGISLKAWAKQFGDRPNPNHAHPGMGATAESLEVFFQIAIALAEILDGLYRHRVIHKDIKPANILIHPATRQVKLIDFSIATLVSEKNQILPTTNLLEGTLAYISPEQTGRMNRGIDYRTDFYSLGVTLYELLTGHLPFTSEDPIELVHCHLAKQPPAVHQIVPQIPLSLSDIVQKLMAKNAEDRYQSAMGLKHDLETCWRCWQEGNAERFELGQRDWCDRFLLSSKLYGRESEIAALLAAFERVTQGSAELVLVTGASGLGKTAIVNEIQQSVLRQRGYFIQGRYDSLLRNVPLSGFVQAFRDLVKQLLTESKAQVERWKTRILNAVDDNGQVLIDVIPEVEWLIGKQPAVLPLEPIAAQNRFNLVFQQFVRLFLDPDHPLVLFLDDLHWADAASLKLIQGLLEEIAIVRTANRASRAVKGGLLLILTHRDDEAADSHSADLQGILSQFLGEIDLGEIDLGEIDRLGTAIHLKPLPLPALTDFIADTLNCSAHKAQLLSQQVFSRTQGNPLFSHQFLKTLHEEGLIFFDPDQGSWQWDLHRIQTIAPTASIVELMATQLQKLSPESQAILQLAACVGGEFSLEMLMAVSGNSPAETAAYLEEAFQAGLIVAAGVSFSIADDRPVENPDRNQDDQNYSSTVSSAAPAGIPSTVSSMIHASSYRFLYDQLRQAAYRQLSDDQKCTFHYQIGQFLLETTPADEQEDKIFAIVNQLNYGIDRLTNPQKRSRLAQLNLTAGRKAEAATAYEAALNYLETGLQLLDTRLWETNYALILEVHRTGAEVAYLSGNFGRTEALVERILTYAGDFLDRIRAIQIQIEAYKAQNQGIAAIQAGLAALIQLGIYLPAQPTSADVERSLQETQKLVAETVAAQPSSSWREDFQPSQSSALVREIAQLPLMTDPARLITMDLLGRLSPIAYMINPALFFLIVLQQVQLSLKHGNCVFSPFAYATYGMILWNTETDLNRIYQFGQLAETLLKQSNAQTVECITEYAINAYIKPWREPLNHLLTPLLSAYEVGLKIGDLEQASHSVWSYIEFCFWQGNELGQLEQESALYWEKVACLKQEIPLQFLSITRQVVLNLLGRSPDPKQLEGDAYSETQLLPLHQQTGNQEALFHYYSKKLFLSYLFDDDEQALQNAAQAEQYLNAVLANPAVATFYCYRALALLSTVAETPAQQAQILQQVGASQSRLGRWATAAPANFLTKFYLVEAERCRVEGRSLEAMDLFDRAIAAAKEYGAVCEEALAGERAAKFYLALGRETIAQTYLLNACYAYQRWGSLAKLHDLEQRYPDWLAVTPWETQPKIASPFASGEIALDLANLSQTSLSALESASLTNSTSLSNMLDLTTMLKASQALASEIHLERLLSTLMTVTLENAGAKKCALLLLREGNLVIEALAELVPDEQEAGGRRVKPTVLQAIAAESSQDIPIMLLNYVRRSQETLVLDDATASATFASDPYIADHQPKSVLCTPIVNQGKLIGLLYLENRLTVGAFTRDRLEVLKLLTTQAAISLENATLYQELETANRWLADYSHQLEQKVAERTQELNDKNQHLEQTLKDLTQTQSQLIQAEKMSGLGQMVAGIAHEINNPINFIHGNLLHAQDYVSSLLELMELYQQEYPQPQFSIQQKEEEIDLEFLLDDLPKLLKSMQVGSDRIRNIVLGLRNFSRLDEADMKPADIHEGIDSTLMILQHRLENKSGQARIQVIKTYAALPQIVCYPGQLNQVFMNILSNAIDALQECSKFEKSNSSGNLAIEQPLLTLTTEQINDNTFRIRIVDNGPGMTEAVKQKIFDPFFTTKPVGSGTGLGLAISYQIIVEKHKGQLFCNSVTGAGTEFVIELPMHGLDG